MKYEENHFASFVVSVSLVLLLLKKRQPSKRQVMYLEDKDITLINPPIFPANPLTKIPRIPSPTFITPSGFLVQLNVAKSPGQMPSYPLKVPSLYLVVLHLHLGLPGTGHRCPGNGWMEAGKLGWQKLKCKEHLDKRPTVGLRGSNMFQLFIGKKTLNFWHKNLKLSSKILRKSGDQSSK